MWDRCCFIGISKNSGYIYCVVLDDVSGLCTKDYDIDPKLVIGLKRLIMA